MPTRAKQDDNTEAILAAAAAGGVIAASGDDDAAGGEVASGQAGAAIGAAVAALRRRSKGADWIVKAIRPEFARADVSDAELAEAARVEQERDVEFYRRMEERMRRDIPAALQRDEPEAAVKRVLERERRFTEAHHEAAAARVQATARRGMVRRLSPEGAFWHLSEAVKEHTPDCLAMATVGWWPWSVLDRINPPTHTGCRCELLTHDEAYDMGLMGAEAPDTEAADRRAQQIAERYGLLQEALLAERVTEMSLEMSLSSNGETPANGDFLVSLTGDMSGGMSQPEGTDVPPADLVLDMEEVAWDERFAKGTVWGGRFRPRRGGFAPRISLNDVLRFLHGTDAPKLAQRGSDPIPARVTTQVGGQAAPGGMPAGTPDVPDVPDGAGGPTSSPVPVPFAGNMAAQKAGAPEDFSGLAAGVAGLAQQIGDTHGRQVVLKSIRINEADEDTGGFRSWDGEVQVGRAAQVHLQAAHAARVEKRRLDDDTAAGVYNAYRTAMHEASHGVNPINPETFAQPEHFSLDEALTEEMAHEWAVELLKRNGQHDVLRWLGRKPDDIRAQGTYLPQRAALGLLLDEAHVPLENRRELLHNLAFSADPEKRFEILGGLLAGAQGVTPEKGEARARDLMARTVEHFAGPGAAGAEVLRQPNYTDHRMRIRAGARVRVTGRKEPWEGVVTDAMVGEDGRWYAEVEVKLRDHNGQIVDTVTRYPDPDDVEFLADPPRRNLKGNNITGPVAEGDVVRIKQNNGDITVAELRKVEDDDALGWKAEALTEDGEMVLLRESSVLDVSRARPGAESRKRARGGDAPEGQGAEGAPEQPLTGAAMQRDKVVERVAAQAHEQWRKDRNYEPRPKPYGGGTIDIADMTYDELPEKFQAENRDGAASAYDAITRMRDEEGALDMERLASEVHDAWIDRNQSWAKADQPELLKPYADLPEAEKEKDRVFVKRTMKEMGIAEPNAEALDIEPGSFDPHNYSDPRRALIRKVRALQRGDSLQAADGSTITRGKRGDSVLIERPDGSRKRYATTNRMSNAESYGIAVRSGVAQPAGKGLMPDTKLALGQASPPATLDAWNPQVDDAVKSGQLSPAEIKPRKRGDTEYFDGLVAEVDGREVGKLTYSRYRPAIGKKAREANADIGIDKIEVIPEFQRRGIATQLMRELEAQNKGKVIDHGYRLTDGYNWSQAYYGHQARYTRDGEPVGSEIADSLQARKQEYLSQSDDPRLRAMAGQASPGLDQLTPEQRQAVQDELTKSMLNGWVEPGEDTADLEALIADAMDQHADDDPDRTPEERRALDDSLVKAAISKATGQASPGLKGKAAEEMLDANAPELGPRQQNAAELYIVDSTPFQESDDPDEILYDPSLDREYKLGPQVKMLRRAMRALPEAVTVYRGGADDGKLRGPFVSTSTRKADAERFGDVQEVTVPAGTKALWLGKLAGENELLLDRESLEAQGGQASPGLHLSRHVAWNPYAQRVQTLGAAGPMPALAAWRGALDRPRPTGFGRRPLSDRDRRNLDELDFYPGQPDASTITLSDGSEVSVTRDRDGTRTYAVKRDVGSVDGLSREEVEPAITTLRDEEEVRALEAIRDADAASEEQLAANAWDALSSVMMGQASPAERPEDRLQVEKGPTANEVLGEAVDTEAKWSRMTPTGRVYADERRALHEEIINSFLEGHEPPSGRKPRAAFTAGGPGSGKSSMLSAEATGMVEVNPDAIKEKLPEYQAMIEARDPYSGAGVHEESSIIARTLRARAFNRGLDVLIDGVGNSGAGRFREKLEQAHADGYDVEVDVAHLPHEKGKVRVAERAERSGRTVPDHIVDNAYRSVPQRFTEYDDELPWLRLRVWDTDVPRGEPAKLIADKDVGGELKILDAEKMDGFLAQGRMGLDGPEGAAAASPGSPAGRSGVPGGGDAALRVGPGAGGEAGGEAGGVGQASPPELPGMKAFLAKMQASWDGGKPERTEEVERSEMEAPPEPVQGIPDYTATKLKDVKPAGGSNGARMAEDAEGRRWLVKTYKGNRDRVATELLANSIYRELGITVPNAGYTEVNVPKFGKTRALTYPLVDGEERQWQHADETLADGFVADALLGNWDVVGLAQDNVLWNGDTPIRLDQGGTLEYRAMGGPKPFGPVPTELWTMNKPGGQAWTRMAITEEGMRAAAKDAELRLTPERIDALVDAAPFDDEEMRERVRENLKARVAWLGRYSRGEEEIPEPLSGEEVLDEFSARDASLETYPEEDAAMEHYLGQGHDVVDAHLRSGAKRAAADAETQGTVAQLDALLGDRVTRVDEDFYAYVPLPADSKINADNAGELAGKWMTEKSYLNAETQYAPTPGVVTLRLTVPTGAHALMPSTLDTVTDPTPGRVVLPRRTSIRITGSKLIDGATVVDAVVKPR